jgi:hypothetical protein
MLLVIMMMFQLPANAVDLDYRHITKGDVSPFSGVVMTNDALVQMIATHEAEVRICELDNDTQLKLNKNDSDKQYELLELKYNMDKELYEELISIRDNQIKKDKTKDVIQRVAFFGGFILGSATSVGIVYSLNQN